jgi:hypothetical protein
VWAARRRWDVRYPTRPSIIGDARYSMRHGDGWRRDGRGLGAGMRCENVGWGLADAGLAKCRSRVSVQHSLASRGGEERSRE